MTIKNRKRTATKDCRFFVGFAGEHQVIRGIDCGATAKIVEGFSQLRPMTKTEARIQAGLLSFTGPVHIYEIAVAETIPKKSA